MDLLHDFSRQIIPRERELAAHTSVIRRSLEYIVEQERFSIAGVTFEGRQETVKALHKVSSV